MKFYIVEYYNTTLTPIVGQKYNGCKVEKLMGSIVSIKDYWRNKVTEPSVITAYQLTIYRKGVAGSLYIEDIDEGEREEMKPQRIVNAL